MNLPIIWSPASREEYADLLAYLERKHGLEPALEFMDKTEAALGQISGFPESGTPTQKDTVRKKVINKQTSVLYQIYEEAIELLHFWDNRQNPENLENIFR